MPFEPAKLTSLREGLWEYKTNDSSAVALAPGYFPCDKVKDDDTLVIDTANYSGVLAAVYTQQGLRSLRILHSGSQVRQ